MTPLPSLILYVPRSFPSEFHCETTPSIFPRTTGVSRANWPFGCPSKIFPSAVPSTRCLSLDKTPFSCHHRATPFLLGTNARNLPSTYSWRVSFAQNEYLPGRFILKDSQRCNQRCSGN